MSAICDYSHPEQQITDGMVRHPTGTLFPYNPEFYELASSLYGPGAIYCWLLLLASVVLSWIYYPKTGDSKGGPGLSNDLWAVLAYPTFAATDALVHAMKMLGTKQRALAYFCLRFPTLPPDGLAEFNHTQLDLRTVPPDILSLGQRVIDLTGPVSVCYLFTSLCVLVPVAVIVECGRRSTSATTLWKRIFNPDHAEASGPALLNPFPCRLITVEATLRAHNRRTKRQFRSSYWALVFACITFSYVCIVLVIFILSFGNLWMSFQINFFEVLGPFILVSTLAFSVLYGVLFFSRCVETIGNWRRGGIKNCYDELLNGAGFLLFGCCFPGILIACVFINDIKAVPDLGVTVTERDQLATLIVGIATLGYTVYGIFDRLRSKAPIEEEATELLQRSASEA
jgi:hypothetical protein